MEDLNALRSRLDELDRTLIGVFEERCRIAEKVGRYKLENGMKVKDAAREQEVIEKRLSYLSDPSFLPETEDFLQEVLLQSRRIQRKLLRENEDAPKNGNYFLVGLPGSGKTSVGRALAGAEGMAFLDTDEYIEKKENLPVGEIFSRKGEAYFRNAETAALREISENEKNTVVATGGGIVERAENRRLLGGLHVFYLYRPIRKILQCRMADRPLLAENPQKIYDLDRKRRAFYREVADYKVHNTESIASAVSQIRKFLDE